MLFRTVLGLCLSVLCVATVDAQGVTRVCNQSKNAVGNITCQDVSSASPFAVAPQSYPAAATPITASVTGSTAASAATLAAVAGRTTYICGFSINSTAAVGTAGNATITGTITGTLNYVMGTGGTPAVVVTQQTFIPCIPAGAVNTSIIVTSAAPGTGGVISVTAWGYQQ